MRQSEWKRLGQRFERLRLEESLLGLGQKSLDKLSVFGQVGFRKLEFANRRFSFQGQELPYFIHSYNATWRNERCIEISLARHFLALWQAERVLELGNVMSYYEDHRHTVIDKYEPSPGILNQDFLDYAPEKLFDGFLAISTFEHIGWDESPRSGEKLAQCFDKIAQLVHNKKQVLVTCPLGYNDYLDDLARSGQLPFETIVLLVRTSKNQVWRTSTLDEALAKEYAYGKKYYGASSLLVGLGVL